MTTDTSATAVSGPTSPVATGRRFRAFRSLARLACLTVTAGAAYVVPLASHRATGGAAGWIVVGGGLFILLLDVVVRAVAALPPDRGPVVGASPEHEECAPSAFTGGGNAPGGIVICCSGGGVKSASFAMGCLERLSTASVWQRAKAVIGVSGGGYMAAAWFTATRGSRPGARTAWSTAQIRSLRARTNYIASSGRVRFDLAGSILLGILMNLLIIAGPLVTFAWIVGGYARATGLAVPMRGTHLEFRADTMWVFVPGELLVVVAVAAFLVTRVGMGRSRPGTLGDGERTRVLAELPNTILGLAVAYTLAVPLLVWTATRVDSIAVLNLSNLGSYVWDRKEEISWAVGLFTTLLGLSHSGAKSKPRATGPILTAWRQFRRLVAPWIAVGIAASFAYWAAALVTAREIYEPFTGWVALGTGGAAVLVFVMARLGSANFSSLFMFYRDRLAYAFLCPAQDRQPGSSPPQAIPLAVSGKPPAGPELVLMATANASGAGYLPTGRNGAPFVLSSREVGFPITSGDSPPCSVTTGAFRIGRQPITVSDAMAISGAAVSPQAGRESKNLGGYRLLLALVNIRLGVWVDNPYYLAEDTSAMGLFRRACLWMERYLDRPSSLFVVTEAIGKLRLDDRQLYLTDGGHYDNLGLVEALRRRPHTIYLLDGSGDDEDSFAAVGDAIATARMDLGVEVAFDPAPLRRGTSAHPSRSWTTMTARLPARAGDGARDCTVVYIKALLPRRYSFDLYAYQARNHGFPTALERLETLDEFDFEAYRQLGWCATDAAIAGLHRRDPARWPDDVEE